MKAINWSKVKEKFRAIGENIAGHPRTPGFCDVTYVHYEFKSDTEVKFRRRFKQHRRRFQILY